MVLIRTRSLGASMGATRADDFPRQADGYGRLTIMPGHGPIRRTLNAGQVSTDLKVGDRRPEG